MGMMNNIHMPPRQSELCRLVALGLSEKEMASTLKISRHTVHTHLKRLYKALQISSRSQLIAWYYRSGQFERDELLGSESGQQEMSRNL